MSRHHDAYAHVHICAYFRGRKKREKDTIDTKRIKLKRNIQPYADSKDK